MVKKTSKAREATPKNTHEFEPTKLGLAVAAAAASCLVLFAVIAFYG